MLTPECQITSAQYRIFIIQATEEAAYLFNLIWIWGLCNDLYLCWFLRYHLSPPLHASVMSVLRKTQNHYA